MFITYTVKILCRLCIEDQYLWYRYKLAIFRGINRFKRRFIIPELKVKSFLSV